MKKLLFVLGVTPLIQMDSNDGCFSCSVQFRLERVYIRMPPPLWSFGQLVCLHLQVCLSRLMMSYPSIVMYEFGIVSLRKVSVIMKMSMFS